jgi:hypothetical protein
MSIVGVPYTRPTDRHAGEQPDGMAWIPRLTSADFTRIMAREVSIAVEAHTYTGQVAWEDGLSEPVGRAGHVIDGAEARDLMREVYDHFAAITAAVERRIAARIGGEVQPNPRPPWIDEPMELTPPDETEPEPEP